MAGAGTMPAGTGPFGLGTPAEAGEPPEGDAGIRYINPGSRDWEQDPDTRQLKQMPELRHRALLTLMTLKGSSTVLENFGVQLPDKMGDGFERAAELSIREAFKQFTDVEQRMRIDQILVTKTNVTGRANIVVQFTDLQTGEDDEVSV